ncbi:MAG TPA: sigma-70 family RNA polymerase sigma factor [Terriglobales bacterium]|jgi:RNA polymerase sigma-70 factor, ECF subfamily|nr:sigma-70 family RNA polymerase sigma factor [Terriglobales bacterium]
MATTCMVCGPRPTGAAAESVHDDMALVHACKRGDVAAFEELVKRYDRKLFRIAQHVTQNREDAQDVVQEAFLKVFRNLSQFREDSQFSTWLVRITINQSLMKVRKVHTKKEVGIDQDSQAETGQNALEFADWAPNPEERYRSSELRAILRKALKTLQPTLSLVFVLRDIEGLSTEQTSEVLDLSQAAVKTRLMRARLQLRDRLSRYFTNGARNPNFSSTKVSH